MRSANLSLEFLRRISRRRLSAQDRVESISEYVEWRAAQLTPEHLAELRKDLPLLKVQFTVIAVLPRPGMFSVCSQFLGSLALDTRLRARRAPFGFSAEGALRPGKSRLPNKVDAIIETAIKKIYLTNVAAVIEEVQMQCFKVKTKETSSAADPATVFDRVSRFPSHAQIISDRLSPFANNVLPFALNLHGAAHIRK